MAYQRTTVKLSSPSDKVVSKALQIAAKTKGRIISVHIQGQQRDELVVIGEFDPTKLIESLRKKKFPFATLVSVQPLTAPERRSSSNYNSRHPYEYYPTMATSTDYIQQTLPGYWVSSSAYDDDVAYPYG